MRWTPAALALTLACAGEPHVDPPVETSVANGPPAAQLRRLSVKEYDRAVEQLVGFAVTVGEDHLPADPTAPFDNMVELQEPSTTFSVGAESAARDAAGQLRERPDALDALRTCTPADASDAGCMQTIVSAIGRRALRRDLLPEDTSAYTALGLAVAASAGSFDEGLLAVIEALLQDPEFVFRWERGHGLDADPTRFRLDGFSIASRMSFFLLGQAPDDALLSAAARGELDQAETRRAIAKKLVRSSRAADTIRRFHAQWLGYETMPFRDDTTALLRDEVDHMINRVVFEERAPWTDLLTARYTWSLPYGVEHYGLSWPHPDPAPNWVPYPESSERSGILSQGAFMSVGNNTLDTSPVKRGKFIRERLMCEYVPPPTNAAIADAPPRMELGLCKADRYAQHRVDPQCASCHATLDPVGFGLERFDSTGAERDYDYQQFSFEPITDCPIEGEGDLAPHGTFRGPRGLAELLVNQELVQPCAVRQLTTWMEGEKPPRTDADIDALLETFRVDRWRLDLLIVDLIASERFVTAEVQP